MIKKKESFSLFGNWLQKKEITREGENVKKERNSLRKQIREIKRFLREAGFSAEEIKYYIMTLQGQLPPTSPEDYYYSGNILEEFPEEEKILFTSAAPSKEEDLENVRVNLPEVHLSISKRELKLPERGGPSSG